MANNNMLLIIILVITTTVIISFPSASSQLTPTFYANSCPSALDTIRSATRSLINREPRIGAFLLRLFFHDCFVNGCDASILLDDLPGSFAGEQRAPTNSALLINLNIVDSLKTQVDRACGASVVSCADIIAVATRDALVVLGGPTYSVPVGRRDSTTANLNGARNQIPDFSDNLTVIIDKFQVKGFNPREIVALYGAHSVGRARCLTFRDRIYNDTNIDPQFALSKQANCPRQGGDDNLEPLNSQSPNRFGNSYFQALLMGRGLLNCDQVLVNPPTGDFVRQYAGNLNLFYTDFANAMVKMGNLSPLTGTQGEVRSNCGRTN